MNESNVAATKPNITFRTANGIRVELSPHALQRFRERGRLIYPGGHLDVEVLATDLLAKKFRRAGMRNRRPGWTFPTADPSHRLLTEGYVVLSEAVAFPIQRINGRLIATTCLVRGWQR